MSLRFTQMIDNSLALFCIRKLYLSLRGNCKRLHSKRKTQHSKDSFTAVTNSSYKSAKWNMIVKQWIKIDNRVNHSMNGVPEYLLWKLWKLSVILSSVTTCRPGGSSHRASWTWSDRLRNESCQSRSSLTSSQLAYIISLTVAVYCSARKREVCVHLGHIAAPKTSSVDTMSGWDVKSIEMLESKDKNT